MLKVLLAITSALLLAASCSGAFVSIDGSPDFRVVRPGHSGTVTFWVRNTGDAQATLGEISTAGVGLAAPFAVTGGSCSTGATVPPHGSCTLQITFSPVAEAAASDTIQIRNTWTDLQDGQPRSAVASLDIFGRGGDGVNITDAPAFDFGAWHPGMLSSQVFYIRNPGAPAITLGDMSAAGLGLDSPFTRSGGNCTTGMTLPAYGGVCHLEVMFGPDAAGTFTDTLTARYAPEGTSDERSLTLGLRGVGASISITVSAPDGDAFGAVPLGSSRTKTYTVRNGSNVAVAFATMPPMRPPFSITGTTCTEFTSMPAGATCTADVTFAPTELGPYKDYFSVSFQDRLAGNLYVTAIVSGGGGDPIYFGNADIGAHPVGATITTPVAVTNVHRVPVTLGTVSAAALQIAAPYTLKSTTCASGAVLEPEASCTLTIAFAPTAIGSAARNIRLAYSWNEGGAQSRTTTGTLNGSGAALRRIKQVAVGKTHKCALFEDGGVRCWGKSERGALGHGSYPNYIGDDEQPAAAGDVDLGGGAVQISAGEDITCALLTTGTVRCWGRSAILGYARELPHYPLRPADLGDIDVGGPVKQIATGAEQTCALLTNGKVRCWGTMGLRGFIYIPPLGYPGRQDIIGDDETPASVGDIDVGGEVAQISAGDAHVCALLTNGKVRCWGDGQYGQLGYGNANPIGDDEHPASAGDVNVGGDVVRLSGGSEHTCAVLASGAVRCWGHGVAGILGYGNTNTIGDNETPASAGDVDIGGAARDVSAGARATCALLSTGSVRCWGHGTEGTLGYGNTNTIGDNETPASAGDVNIGGSVAQISTEGVPVGFHPWGENGMCALLTTGTVRCWGMRYLGYPGVVEPVGDNELPFTVGDVAVQ